jgi:uncharacterized protein GlcG (DUF336 family)
MHHFRLLFALTLFLTILGGCQGAGVSAYPTGGLSTNDVSLILDQAEAAAKAQPSLLRVNAHGQPQTCRMHIMVMNRKGDTIGRRAMDDAWHGSVSIAKSKAYSAMAFSSNENALSTRSLGALTQPGGPLWNIGNSNQPPGLIEFPGGLPLYKNGKLVGGIGVSGDGVDQDESVAAAGASGFEPSEGIRVDSVTKGAVPYKK